MNTTEQVRVRFDGVGVEFPTEQGAMRVLDHVSFDLHQGEFVSIIGPSGCGKSTLMNLLAGFLQPTQGRVLLDGSEVLGPGPDRGVIFQEYGVFPWLTVRQNIEFGMTLAANKVPAPQRAQTADKYMGLMGLSIKNHLGAACIHANANTQCGTTAFQFGHNRGRHLVHDGQHRG